ncbi:PEP-CTERM sorting domain-containing protein [Accumulibacter sp.]
MIDDFTFNATFTGVPEPLTLLLSLAGLGLIGLSRPIKRRVDAVAVQASR